MEFGIGFIIGFACCMAVLTPVEMKWQKRIYRKAYDQAVEDLKPNSLQPSLVVTTRDNSVYWGCPKCQHVYKVKAKKKLPEKCEHCGCKLDWKW